MKTWLVVMMQNLDGGVGRRPYRVPTILFSGRCRAPTSEKALEKTKRWLKANEDDLFGFPFDELGSQEPLFYEVLELETITQVN